MTAIPTQDVGFLAGPHGIHHGMAEAEIEKAVCWECDLLGNVLYYWAAAVHHDVLS